MNDEEDLLKHILELARSDSQATQESGGRGRMLVEHGAEGAVAGALGEPASQCGKQEHAGSMAGWRDLSDAIDRAGNPPASRRIPGWGGA